MPGEKHVEPLADLSGGGACGGSAGRGGCAQSCDHAGRDKRQASRSDRSSEGCGNHAGQTAEQCAGGCRPLCMPVRLSKSLRGRATRRRSGAAMPGEEQGKSLGELPAGRQRRHRRHGASGRRGTGDCCCCARWLRRRPRWCCEKCCRARSFSSRGRLVPRISAPFARASCPAAAVSCSVCRFAPLRCRQRAGMS